MLTMEESLKAYLSENFGKLAKDTITDYVGKITATAFYISGTQRVELSAMVNGKVEEAWFDVGRIELME